MYPYTREGVLDAEQQAKEGGAEEVSPFLVLRDTDG